jgi:hypothetical protein
MHNRTIPWFCTLDRPIAVFLLQGIPWGPSCKSPIKLLR